MKYIIIFILLFLVLILCENDRKYKIKHSIISYYINNFPNQIYFGIHNSIYRWYYPNKEYSIYDFSIENELNTIKESIISDYYNYKNSVLEYAHDTSAMLEKDYNYKYIRLLFLGKSNTNLQYFNTLTKFLMKNKNIKTCFMSILEGKKTIPYHRGPYNGMLRYHYPLIIEDFNDCYIEVLGKKYKYNQSFVFDDTYPHQLVKNSNSLRVVLIMDIDNPYSLYPLHKLFY